MDTESRQSLRQRLEAGYRANAERDLEIAAEWFPLDEEASAHAKSKESPLSGLQKQKPNDLSE